MAFTPKPTKKKIDAVNKSIYIKSDLLEKVNEFAKQYDTSFNNIVISILEDFFNREEESNDETK